MINENILTEEETLNDVANFFKIFGDQTRIKIIASLLNKELCVQDIADTVKMNQSAVSHQLRILRSSNIVKSKRDGKSIIYSLNDEHVEKIFSLGYEHITE